MVSNVTAYAAPLALSRLGDPNTILRAIPSPAMMPVSYAVTAVVLLITLYSIINPEVPTNKQLPLASKTRLFDIGGFRAMKDFLDHAFEQIHEAHKKFNDNPYRMLTDAGEVTMLPYRYASEVKSDPRLSFDGPIRRSMHAHMRGFSIFREGGMENHLVVDVVRQDLTRELSKVTVPLTEETAYVLKLLLTDNTEWHEVKLKDTVQEIVARLSSRVFLGDELCRNRAWLDLTIQATITTMTASGIMRMFPRFLRPLVNEILPMCRAMRAEYAKAASLILPIIAKRHALRQKLEAEGASKEEMKTAIKNDGIEWFERMSSKDGRFYKPEMAQITLSVAAIHTTSDLLTQLILDLATHPEILESLRAEIREVLGKDGWKKTALYNLRLMDSCIRETQRLKPIGMASMRREVLADITLSDGTHLRKGSEVMVSGLGHWDSTVYANPNEWDGYRFYRLRQQPGNENAGQAAITSGEHLAFGHGQHSCPGRFFAVNEAKIAMAHLIMKYDFKLAGDATPKTEHMGLSLMADMGASLSVRRRNEEIDLDSLTAS